MSKTRLRRWIKMLDQPGKSYAKKYAMFAWHYGQEPCIPEGLTKVRAQIIRSRVKSERVDSIKSAAKTVKL